MRFVWILAGTFSNGSCAGLGASVAGLASEDWRLAAPTVVGRRILPSVHSGFCLSFVRFSVPLGIRQTLPRRKVNLLAPSTTATLQNRTRASVVSTFDSEYSELTDRQLLEKFATDHDDDAFRVIVERHGSMVMRVSRRLLDSSEDAEDVFQATFLVLARKMRHVKWHDSLANWLFGVTNRLALAQQRRRARNREKLIEMPENHGQSQRTHTFPDQDGEKLIYSQLAKLEEKFRAPIVLCCLEGKSRKEAAEELGVSEQTVKGRLERGRKLLLRKLGASNVQAGTMLLGGGLAGEIARTQIPDSILRATVQTAVQCVVSVSLSSVTSNSLNLARGEMIKMTLSQFKLGLLAIATISLGCGLLLFAQNKEPVQETPIDAWQNMEPKQQDEVTLQNLKVIISAVHAYIDEHNGVFPPAVVPNPQLPNDKRLSGLVLLLPYLGMRPSYIDENDAQWNRLYKEYADTRELFQRIDLSKAWDAAENLEAAKTLVHAFLSPHGTVFRTESGLAVSHFAFVRGSLDRENGIFPLSGTTKLSIPDVRDGTSTTVAIGQIHDHIGPWIAAGASTARFLHSATERTDSLGFGSPYDHAAFFANADGFTYLLDLASSDPDALNALGGRHDGLSIDRKALRRFSDSEAWKIGQSLDN